MNLNEKISALRGKMQELGVDLFMTTTEDAYLAESADDYWRGLRWLTGFSGTLAYAMVTQDKVSFWTDARYTIQAKRQVVIDGVEIFDVTQVGADYYLDWIIEQLSALPGGGLTMAVDGRTITTAKGNLMRDNLERLAGKTCAFRADMDLVGLIWPDRPAPAYQPIFEHDLKYAGVDRQEKLAALRRELAKEGADHTIVGTMEGVNWLVNMRGRDIVNPLFMSHALVTPTEAKLFAKIEMIPGELQSKLKADGYQLYDIDRAAAEISAISPQAVMYYDQYRVNYFLFTAIPAQVKKVQGFDLVNNMKALKNPVEIQNFKHTNAMECAALFKFYLYLKEHAAEGGLNEYNVARLLYDYRASYPELVCHYPLMTAYMQNAAGPHYFPTEDVNVPLQPSGVAVIDAVGHYLGGTTDITRTIYLGPCGLEAELKHDYTLTLISLTSLLRQVFRDGADGAYLDSVPRRVMWNERLHYGYGTGHGIGYCIVPHEGPQFISEPSYKKEWAFCFLPLKPDMVMAMEPGIYKEGKYGVRLEDNVYIVDDTENEFGRFYRFENLTYLPFERELIDLDMLTKADIAWLNHYHQKCRETLSPYMDPHQLEALERATAPLNQ